jgi:hypothetical protein
MNTTYEISRLYPCIVNLLDYANINEEFDRLEQWVDNNKNNTYNIVIGSGDGILNKNRSNDAVMRLVHDYHKDEITEVEAYSDFDIHINIGEANHLEKNAKYISSNNKLSSSKRIILLDITIASNMQQFCKIFEGKIQIILTNFASLMMDEPYAKQLMDGVPNAEAIIDYRLYIDIYDNLKSKFNLKNRWNCSEQYIDFINYADRSTPHYMVCSIISEGYENKNKNKKRGQYGGRVNRMSSRKKRTIKHKKNNHKKSQRTKKNY